MYFIPEDDARKVLETCPDAERRVIFALSRYGGMRCPSEHLALRWKDIDWIKQRITVWSCKTEGHAGKEFRVMPLFPPLRVYLEELYQQAAPGAEFIITRYRDPSVNLRTQFLRILARAGVKPWPKLFHNLRSTRQTELTEVYPTHVVCAWLGNSPTVAQNHYLQVRDQHFEMAIGGRANTKAAQKAAQHAAELARTEPQTKQREVAQGAPVQSNTAPCAGGAVCSSDPMGVRTTHEFLEENRGFQNARRKKRRKFGSRRGGRRRPRPNRGILGGAVAAASRSRSRTGPHHVALSRTKVARQGGKPPSGVPWPCLRTTNPARTRAQRAESSPCRRDRASSSCAQLAGTEEGDAADARSGHADTTPLDCGPVAGTGEPEPGVRDSSDAPRLRSGQSATTLCDCDQVAVTVGVGG
jgi:hypothetical protein